MPGASFFPVAKKFAPESTVNASQFMSTTRNLLGPTEMPKPALAPLELVEVCKDRLDAIRLCVQLSRLSNEVICERLGIDPGHFTRMMQGRAWFPDSKSVLLMQVCGNYAPMQYEAMACGFELYESAKEKRKAELLAELERLEAAA